jgi:hypothetical protein
MDETVTEEGVTVLAGGTQGLLKGQTSDVRTATARISIDLRTSWSMACFERSDQLESKNSLLSALGWGMGIGISSSVFRTADTRCSDK